MDPDQCLKELMELNKEVGDVIDSYGSWVELAEEAKPEEVDELIANVNDLVDHVAALNGWMKKGGFLPEEWAPRWTSERLNSATPFKLIQGPAVVKNLAREHWTLSTHDTGASKEVVRESHRRGISLCYDVNNLPLCPDLVDEEAPSEARVEDACLEYLSQGGRLVKLPDELEGENSQYYRFYCVLLSNQLPDVEERDTLPG